MFVGVSRLVLHLPGNNSLKGKRSIVRGVIDRTKAKFGVSIAEVGDNDVLRRAVIGVAVISNSSAHVSSMLNHVSAFIERLGLAPVASIETDVIPIGDELKQRGIAEPIPSEPSGFLRGDVDDVEEEEQW